MISVISLICGCVLVYSLLNIYIVLERRKYKHFKSPPIPASPIWFLGVLPEFLSYTKKTKGLVLYEFYRVYGWELFVIPIFTRNFIFCMDLQILYKVCNDRIKFPKTDDIQKILGSIAGERIFGDHGLLSDPGSDLWAAKRKVMDPSFHKSSLKTIMIDLNMVTDHLVNRLQNNCSSAELDIFKELTRASFEFISVIGFNWNQELLLKHGEETLSEMITVIDTISLAFREIFTFDLPWNRRREKRKLKEIIPKVRQFIKGHLLNRMSNVGNDQDDILSHIIRTNHCSDRLTVDDLVDEYLLFVMAGMDTTAITMATTLFYLAAYPSVLDKVQLEVNEVFGDKEEIIFDDLNKLLYLEMVIKEVLRLKPPVTWTARQCKEHNVTLNGSIIPKGAEIIIPIQEIHRDPHLWECPEHFDPDRFSSAGRRSCTNFSFLPFMMGQRRCIGRNLAMLEIKTVISRIVREFEIESVNPDIKDIEVGGALTSRPLNGINVRLFCRK
jgi:cytochrome P450